MNLINYSNNFSATIRISGFVISGIVVRNASLAAIGACEKIGALVADSFNNKILAQDLRSSGNRLINSAKQNIGAELKIAAELAVVSIVAENLLNSFPELKLFEFPKKNLSSDEKLLPLEASSTPPDAHYLNFRRRIVK